MNQLRLKFTSKNQAESVLSTCSDVIESVTLGIICNLDGIYSDDGELITPATTKNGWHVDVLISDDCNELNKYNANPLTPRHSFAGW